MPRNRRGHAEPRVRIDIGGADIALDELVGGVIILGQHLAREVKGHAIGPVIPDGRLKAAGHEIERRLPIGGFAANLR